MPEYTIWRLSTSQLHGQGGSRDTRPLEDRGKAVAAVTAQDAQDALTRFLSEGGVEGRRIELTVRRDPRGQDEASVEVAYQMYVARRAKPILLAEEPRAMELDVEDVDEL